MRVLMISVDRKVFEEGSAVRDRMLDYGTLFDQLHIVVFTLHSEGFQSQQLADNVWAHPTNSRNLALYFFDYLRVIRQQVVFKGELAADVVSAQDPAEVGFVAWVVSWRYRVKLHLQIHADIFNTYYGAQSIRHKVHQLLARFLVTRADGIRVVSTSLRDDLLRRVPYLEERIRILPIFTDTTFLQNAEASFDLHDKYKKFTFIILSVGRFTDEKNLFFMLEVFGEIVKKLPRAGLILVGDGINREKLEQYTLTHNLFPNVVIEPWQADLVSHYKTANLFLLTSKHEGHSRVLVEAAAAGIPFVASDVGVASLLTDEQKKHIVCPVDDKTCFVQKITNFMSDQKTRLMYSLNIRDTILSQISESKEEYLEAYKDDFAKTFYFGEET